MSNKKTLTPFSDNDAKKIGVVSLADRPNAEARYGEGGLSAKALKERFDALPNKVRDEFKKIAEMLASKDAPKYITIGEEGADLGETLYDFLLLFGKKGDGITDKNISDYIQALYQKEGDGPATSCTLAEIITDMQLRIVAKSGGVSEKTVDEKIEAAVGRVLNTEVEG